MIVNAPEMPGILPSEILSRWHGCCHFGHLRRLLAPTVAPAEQRRSECLLEVGFGGSQEVLGSDLTAVADAFADHVPRRALLNRAFLEDVE